MMNNKLYSKQNRKLVFDWLMRNLKPTKGLSHITYCWDYVNYVIEDCNDWGSFELSRWDSKSGNPEVFSLEYLEV
jgi:hypothetical protein